jgi:hypothetical protein
MSDKAAATATTISYAPPSLSVRVRCAAEDRETHRMSGLFVILRMAVAGPPHASLDKVVAVHDAAGAAQAGTPDAPAQQNPDAAALANRFVCTIVDMHGFLQPVHDDSNPWHEIFAPDPPGESPKKGVPPKNRDIARIPVDTDGKFVGCLLRHPQPSMARALTNWLNTGNDGDGHGFDKWKKSRPAPLAGEKPLDGRELLAAELDISKDSSNGAQLVLKVSENAADFLPPKFESHGGWLLYRDMPHQNCPAVIEQVKVLQRRLGLLRFPIGGEETIYAPDKQNDGSFDTRTLSAVRAFQQQAALGKAVEPLAWPPGHTDASDGKHDWWFVIGREVAVDKLEGVLPACADEKTWAQIDKWVQRKVRKPGMILVKNPSSYMRWDAALSVLAWRKLVASFGVNYPSPPALPDETELASQYALADLNAGLQLTIAHPHKTGHALDFGVVIDQVGPLSDWAQPRPAWPIHYEGQWWLWRWSQIDPTPKLKAKLAAEKAKQKTAATEQRQKAAAEKASQAALDRANALTPPDAGKQKAAESAYTKAVAAREQADKKLADANDAVDKAQADFDAAPAKFEAAKKDPEHRGWAIHFRLYGHSRLDVFGDGVDSAFDELYRSVDGMTAALITRISREFGDTPAAQRDAFLKENLKFLADLEEKLKNEIGPPDRRNRTGRASVLGNVFRATVQQWIYNPYSRAAGKPGDEVHPGADPAPIDYLDADKDWKANVPPGSKSFVNLTYLGWTCKMYRISQMADGLRDPRMDAQKGPRQTLSSVKLFFGRIVGLIDRMNRSDSNEKQEAIVCSKLERHIPDLDLEFMKRWARALPAVRPKPPKGIPVVVTTSDPQVTMELVAKEEMFPQLKTVFDKLEESGKNLFALVDVGKNALLDPGLIAQSGKPGLVETDKGKIDTGSAWRAKLENVATLFKDKVATANITADNKAASSAAKKPPVRSEKRDPKDLQITLQPVFEKVTPKGLADVAFQPQHSCDLTTPGHGEPLEWWHYQHQDSIDRPYHDMLQEIGYAPDLLFLPREPHSQDEPNKYAGRGIGANPVQEFKPSLAGGAPKAPENGDTESAKVW